MLILSVIIPIYNTGKYLKECIESVLNSQFSYSLEIILVDDESPDGAGAICDEYKRMYSNIKVIHKKNEGLGEARNSGLQIACGEYVTFLDSDDFIKKDYYESLIKEIIKQEADICYAGGIINVKNKKEQVIDYFIEQKLYTSKEEIVKLAPRIIGPNFKNNDELPGSSCLAIYSRRFLKDNKIKFVSERELISEDIWFNLECIAKAKKIIYTSIIGYMYRYNQMSLSRGYNPERFDKLVYFEKSLLSKCESLKLINYYERIEMNFWRNFEKCINQEVRFNKKNDVLNIKRMCEYEMSTSFLNDLQESNLISGFHRLLLILLLKKDYKKVTTFLYIYNKLYNIMEGRK